jgi:hypothetical protein
VKIIATILLVLGIIATFIGILPFIFAYPYCNGCANSGPSSFWELILMLSYDGKVWYLLIGITLLLFSGVFFFKQPKI